MSRGRARALALAALTVTCLSMWAGLLIVAVLAAYAAGSLANRWINGGTTIPTGRVRALIEQWQDERADYPAGPDGRWAATAVKCCEDELRALLPEEGR